MSMVCGLDLHRRQITFDALDGRVGRVVAGPGVAAGSGTVPAVATRRRDSSSAGRPGGVGGGGLHRLAVCRRGDRGGGVRGACRRAGRHASGAGAQASRQDRPHRCSADPRVVGGGGAAGVVDPADRRVGVARAGAAVQVVGRSAHHVVSAHPCRAVSTWRRGARGCDPHRARRGRSSPTTGVQLSPAAPAADPGRLSDDRRDRYRGPAAQTRPATLRCPPARVSGVGRRAVRDRWTVRGGGVVRARRLPPVLPLRDKRCVTPASTSPSMRRIGVARVDICPARDPRRCGGRSTKRRRTRHINAAPTTRTTPVKERHGGKIAAISVARQFARRCYHILRNLDSDIVYAIPT